MNEMWEDEQLIIGHQLFYGQIMEENIRQINKWGIQNRTPEEWMLYLTEEVGELAQAISEHKYRNGSREDIIKEATQVTTLAMKILEMNLRIQEAKFRFCVEKEVKQ